MKKILLIFALCLVPYALLAEPLPAILSDEDAATYTQIFALQNDDKFMDAKKLDATVSDPILMSDVLCQRYLAKKYKTSKNEISNWMEKYYANPCADKIEKQADKKKIKVRAAKFPTVISGKSEPNAKSEEWTRKGYGGAIGRQITKFRRDLAKGNSKNAREILENKDFKKKVSAEDYGRLAGRLAFVYYSDGQTDNARYFGDIAAENNSEYGLWTMGLIAFRDREFNASKKYFGRLMKLDQINNARKIEAAFWAGRAAENADDNAAATEYWKIGAMRPQTFYGALSATMLGQSPKYEFFDTEWSREDIAELMKTKYGMAALAAIQIGQNARAEQYLRMLITADASDRLLHAVHAIASEAGLPRISIQVAGVTRDREITEIDPDVIFSAQYPTPDWEPMGGWSIDRAVLFAITRQESMFQTGAESRAGARGLMQIMPKTAKKIADAHGADIKNIDMSKPEHNMYLGQQYIVDLLAMPDIDNNIVKMLIAYNSGEAALFKWESKFATDDPLLFIESYPFAESRTYVKRVFQNMWLYRAKLGQRNDSINELINGQWPKYNAEDDFVQLNTNVAREL